MLTAAFIDRVLISQMYVWGTSCPRSIHDFLLFSLQADTSFGPSRYVYDGLDHSNLVVEPSAPCPSQPPPPPGWSPEGPLLKLYAMATRAGCEVK